MFPPGIGDIRDRRCARAPLPLAGGRIYDAPLSFAVERCFRRPNAFRSGGHGLEETLSERALPLRVWGCVWFLGFFDGVVDSTAQAAVQFGSEAGFER